jgi:hypothetical protein
MIGEWFDNGSGGSGGSGGGFMKTIMTNAMQ